MKCHHVFVLGFLGAILVGMLLFMLPISSPAHTWMKPMDALFTSCSAVCITGLTVIDVGRDLSLCGQIFLLGLVQIGCLGIMTTGTFLLIMAGNRYVSQAQEYSVVNGYGTSGVRSLRHLIVSLVILMAVIEGGGTWALHHFFEAQLADNPSLPADSATWFRAYFYSVMAFCNAGFGLDAGSLAIFGSYPSILVVMALLAIAGGLGFPVMYNLATTQYWRRNFVKRGRWTLNTRVVLFCTVAFLVATYVFFMILEWKGSLEPFSTGEKFAVGLFQAVTPRTCGFTVVPVTEQHVAMRFVEMVLMFIGAAPGGAGGGIKVTTFAVFVSAMVALCRRQRETVMFKRTIMETTVRDSIVIVMVFAAMVVVGMTVLLISDGSNEALSFESLLFETVSAVSTTGLSCGTTTASLSTVGRIVLMLCMFGGRLGALAVVLLVSGQESGPTIRYPREELVVG